MTINGYSNLSYPPSLGGTSPAASGFAQISAKTDASPTASSNADTSIPGSKKSAFDASLRQAAEAKLQSIDPNLAQKMDAFHQQIDQLAQNGASPQAIAQAMKSDMDSLSAPEKNEVQSTLASSKPRHHHHASASADSNTTSATASGSNLDPTPSNSNGVTSPTASSSLTQLIDSFLKAQGSSAYGKSQSVLSQLKTQMMPTLAA